MQLKDFCLPNIKMSLCVFSLCAEWVKSCPNPVNNSTTWKKFKILSFYPRQDAVSEKTISRYCPFKPHPAILKRLCGDSRQQQKGATFFHKNAGAPFSVIYVYIFLKLRIICVGVPFLPCKINSPWGGPIFTYICGGGCAVCSASERENSTNLPFQWGHF